MAAARAQAACRSVDAATICWRLSNTYTYSSREAYFGPCCRPCSRPYLSLFHPHRHTAAVSAAAVRLCACTFEDAPVCVCAWCACVDVICAHAPVMMGYRVGAPATDSTLTPPKCCVVCTRICVCVRMCMRLLVCACVCLFVNVHRWTMTSRVSMWQGGAITAAGGRRRPTGRRVRARSGRSSRSSRGWR